MLFKNKKFYLGLVILALIPRLWGLDYGLPFLYNVDEAQVVPAAIRFGSGDLNPHTFVYPPFFHYILFFLDICYFVTGYILRVFESVHQFKIAYFSDPSPFYLIGRIASAVFGSLTVLATCLLGKKLYNRKTGVLASVFLIFYPLHFLYSRLALPDVAMTCFATVSLIALVGYYQSKRSKDLIIAGLLAGFAVATKYTTGLIVLPFLAVHWLHWRQAHWHQPTHFLKRLVLGYVFILAGFLIANPFSVIDFSAFVRDMQFNSLASSNPGSFFFGFGHYVRELFLPAWGEVGHYFGILCLIGSLYALYKRTSADFLLLLFAWVQLLVFSKLVANPIKPVYILPVMPIFFILGARLLSDLFDQINKRLPFGKAFSVLILAVLLFWPVKWTIIKCYSASRNDTVTVARQWIETHIPAGSKILYTDKHDLMLKESRDSIMKKIDSGEEEIPIHYEEKLEAIENYEGPTYEIVRLPHLWGGMTEEKMERTELLPPGVVPFEKIKVSVAYWLRDHVDYVILFPKQRAVYLSKASREAYPYYYEFYANVENHGKLLKRFDPDRIHFTGYAIEIYAFLKDSQDLKPVN